MLTYIKQKKKHADKAIQIAIVNSLNFIVSEPHLGVHKTVSVYTSEHMCYLGFVGVGWGKCKKGPHEWHKVACGPKGVIRLMDRDLQWFQRKWYTSGNTVWDSTLAAECISVCVCLKASSLCAHLWM